MRAIIVFNIHKQYSKIVDTIVRTVYLDINYSGFLKSNFDHGCLKTVISNDYPYESSNIITIFPIPLCPPDQP